MGHEFGRAREDFVRVASGEPVLTGFKGYARGRQPGIWTCDGDGSSAGGHQAKTPEGRPRR
jgi:hypothetical protein